MLANNKLRYLFAVAAAHGKQRMEKKTWASAFRSGKLSTVAVLCLQAARKNDIPPPGAAFYSGSSGSPPTRPSGCAALWAQLLLWSTSHTQCEERMASQWLGLRLLGLGLLLTLLALTGELAFLLLYSQFRLEKVSFFGFILHIVLVWKCVWSRRRCKLVAWVWGSVEKLKGQFLSYC